MQAEAAALPNFDAWYSEELPAVYRFLVRLGARGADLEDLAHDVFATAIRRHDSYDPRRPLRPWLLGIAYRVALDSKRSARATRESPIDAPEQISESDPERSVHQREARDLLAEALAKLPDERRAAVVMYELEHLSVAEIAAAFEAPAQTIYSRLRIGREELSSAVRQIQMRRGEA